MLFDAARPVILNGIEDIVTRPDLADRAVFLTLEPIPEERRRPEQELWAAFEAERPRILGVLLDAVAKGLAELPRTKLDKLPRMADFALWATACETALWPSGTFWSAYCGNRDEAVDGVIEADPIAAAVRAVMTTRTEWTGTASELLGALAEMAGERVAKAKTWPDSPRALAGRLRRAATFLRKIGIDIGFEREGRARTRMIRITTTGEPACARNPRGATVRIVRTARRSAEGQFRQRLRLAGLADGRQRRGRFSGRKRRNRPRQPAEFQRRDRCGRCGRKSPVPIRAGKCGLERRGYERPSSPESGARCRRSDRRRWRCPHAGRRRRAAARPCWTCFRVTRRSVIALLRTGSDGWSGEDWRAFFDERAAIAEFDGGLPRASRRGPRLRLLRRRMAEPQSGALAARPLPRLRWKRTCPRHAAALRHRTDRPCLAAFALLGRMARGPEGRSGRRPFDLWNPMMRTSL